MASHNEDDSKEINEWLIGNLEKLFHDKTNCDVTIHLPDGQIQAHKSVLIGVPVFEAMFSSGMTESQTKTIEIVDSDVKSFEALLLFVYCGKLPGLEFDLKLAKSMLVLAKKYDVPHLLPRFLSILRKRFGNCENMMLIEEVTQVMEVAELLDDSSIRELCENALTSRFDTMLENQQGQGGDPASISESVLELLVFAHAYRCNALKIRCMEYIRSSTFLIDGRFGERLKAHPDLLLEILNFYRSPTHFTKSFQTLDLPVGWSRICYLNPHLYRHSSPGEFYVHIADADEDLEVMYEKIASTHAEAPALVSPREGMPCLARYDQDGHWYRAEIQHVESDGSLTLQYIDYGNTARVPHDESNVKDISGDLLSLPVQSIRCRVSEMVPVDGDWTDGAKGDFRELVKNRDLLLQCVSQARPSGITPAFPLIHEVRIGKINADISNRFVRILLAADQDLNDS